MTHLQEPTSGATIVNGVKLAPQQKLVYDYLMSGRTLSTMIGITSLAVGDVRTRVAELRKIGVAISKEWAEDFQGGKYKKYFIEAAREARANEVE